MKVNYKLKEYRARKNIKQSELAKLLGISHTTYNRKENGLYDFTETEIKSISKALDVDPNIIFFHD